MSSAEPLKSAISYENREDTSLALPSVNQCRSGAQRVREQLQTIKRTKSKHFSAKSGPTSLSPTSPFNDSNGSVFFSNGFSRSFSLEKNINNHQMLDNSKRQTTKKSSTYSGFRYKSNHGLSDSLATDQIDTSRSEPALALQPKSSVPPQRMLTKKSTYVKSRSSSSSQYIKRLASQSHQKSVPNGQVRTQYHSGVPISPVQIKPQASMYVSNGSAQTKSQYSPVQIKPQASMYVSNGSAQTKSQYSPVQIKPQASMYVSNGSAQTKSQYSPVQIKPQASTYVSNGYAQTKSQYSPVQIKPQPSMYVSNGSAQTKSQYSPVQIKPQPSMFVSNGSGQINSQYHGVVPNGLSPVKTSYPAVGLKSPEQIRARQSMFVSSSSGQTMTQHPTVVPKSPGQIRARQSMFVSSSSGQNKSQYSIFTPNGPEQIKAHQSMIDSNGSGHIKSQYVKGSQSGLIKTTSTTVTDGSTKIKETSGVNETTSSAPITLKDAVEFLSKDDENYQSCGASFIQHKTFISDSAKEEVLKLNGIPPLVNLLRSSSSQVRYTTLAALRNLSYRSDSNKHAIHRCNGIPAAVTQLKDSDSADLNKQLTGLLWNLSSADYLKSELMKEALPSLTEHVILPYANHTTKTERDPEVFFHATGCIRNLSSANQESRRMMRKQKSLVTSLVGYIKECVDQGQDDDSLVNCLCILHNLSFKLESEAPDLFRNINALARSRSQSYDNISPAGCFSSPAKPYECHFDYPVIEEQKPSGAGFLIHSTTLQSYLTLLGPYQRDETRETCCKIMQNLTSNNNVVSNVMSEMIVQKLNGMQFISPLLTSDTINLQTSAMGLVGNFVKNPNLHTVMSTRAFPELATVLGNGMDGVNDSDDSYAMACQAASTLLLGEPEINKKLLNHNLVESLQHISRNKYFPKSSKASSLLLLNMWSDKELQSHLRKKGMTKNMFVNGITMAAQRSAQGI